MEKEQEINIIRQKCIEANPEIVELKFGCEIKSKRWSKNAIFLRMVRGGRYAYIRPDHMELKEAWSEDIEIIGRPIRLADIILAWRKSVEPSMWWNPDVLVCIISEWDSSKDDLTLQSPETIAFLTNLLKL